MSFQKATIGRSFTIEGAGLHSGQRVSMYCHPAESGEGITFVRTDLEDQPRIHSSAHLYCEGAGRRSVIGNKMACVDTTEHFFAALWGSGITDILIEINNVEMPVLDGSASGYLTALQNVGVRYFEERATTIMITEPLFVSKSYAAILAMPSDRFKVTYTLDYNQPMLSKMVFDAEITQTSFIKDIASARTFCTKKEADALLSAGYGKGADTHNTLVMDIDGPIDNQLMWDDECARHKVLDLIGDMSVLGLDIKAHLIAIRSGHELNHQLAKMIEIQNRSFA